MNQELFPKQENYTVEDLNPRSRAVKDLEMSARRGIALAKLCRRHLDLCQGDVAMALRDDPRMWGSMTKKAGTKDHNPHSLLNEAFGGPHNSLLRHHWRTVFMAWYTGGLEIQIQGILRALPKAVAKKYKPKGLGPE